MCEAGVSSTSPSSRISSLEGQVHLLAVPEHLLLQRCFGTNPLLCQVWVQSWAPSDTGAGSMKWSTHLALSFNHVRSSRAECLNTSVLAGYWWLGHFAGTENVFVLKFSWTSTQCMWTVCLDLPAAGLEGEGQDCHGWSGAVPWAVGQKHCWKKTKWSWENWQEKKGRKFRELVSRIFVFALDHKARWDHLCEKTSLWRLI